MLLVREPFFIRRRTAINAAVSAVKAHPAIVADDDPLVINVVNYRDVHIGDGAVIFETAALPASAFVAVATVAETVVHAAVESDVLAPIAFVPGIAAITPSPVARGPEIARLRSFDPGARNPVVAVVG